MARPRLLDTYCKAGGASMGYHRAGFDVVGVDIEPQPNYPFPFIQADALKVLADRKFLGRFDAVHASPVCKKWTAYRRRPDHVPEYEDLIGPTRKLLEANFGGPWVMENIPGAPLRPDIKLCGSPFGLDVQRHRWFETNVPGIMSPPCVHGIWTPRFAHATNRKNLRRTVEVGVYRIPLPVQQAAMGGVDWMTLAELSQAVPPAYAEYVGGYLLEALEAAALPVPPRFGSWPRSSRPRVPCPPAGQDPPAARVRCPFGGLGGEVGGGEGEGPSVLVSRAGVGCGDGLAVEVADGAAAASAGVGGADVARVEPEPGVGAGGEQVLDGAETWRYCVPAVITKRGGSPLGPHGAAERAVAGLGAGAGSQVPGHAITVAGVSAQRLSARKTRRIAAVTGLPVIRAWSHGGYVHDFVTAGHLHGWYSLRTGEWGIATARVLHYDTCPGDHCSGGAEPMFPAGVPPLTGAEALAVLEAEKVPE